MPVQDVRAVTERRPLDHHRDMDSFGMVVIAISALALLEVAAANLRGEERHRRIRRTHRPAR
jgi:hypothetical protein